MKLTTLSYILCVFSTVNAATVFSTDPSTVVQPNQTLTNGQSATYSIGVVGDTANPLSIVAPGENNDATGVIGEQGRVTFSSMDPSTTGSIIIGNPTQPTFLNSFDITTVGDIGTFMIEVNFLNATGGTLSMTPRISDGSFPPFFPATHGPIASVVGIDASGLVDHTVGISLFNAGTSSTGTLVDPGGTGYSTISSSTFATTATALASPNTERLYDFGDHTGIDPLGNVLNFGDGDKTDDFYSTVKITFTPDSGTFAAGSNWRLSFDGQIQGVGTIVPEPTSTTLLGLGALGLLTKRRRK